MLKHLVGGSYGPSPIDNIVQIRDGRTKYYNEVMTIIDLSCLDRVADVGSGMGWFAEQVSDEVQSVLCLDIDERFLKCAKDHLVLKSNISFSKINYGEFEEISHHKINKIIALSLFSQFTFYDVIFHLKSFHKFLPVGGMLYFDFMNVNYLDIDSNKRFIRHNEFYLKNRTDIISLLNWNSPELITRCLTTLGFKIIHQNFNQEFSNICVIKIRE